MARFAAPYSLFIRVMYVHAEPSAARLLACPAKKQRAEPPSKLIPAGAGNTSRGTAQTDRSAVHPRWRGEHSCTGGGSQSGNGSSPLARGTHRGGAGSHAKHRFIPAGAGNTYSAGPSVGMKSVHPRWRGEHMAALCTIPSLNGSSPLARGTHAPFISSVWRVRFIPAGAGNT